jgi:hypothetical protein
MLNKIKSNLYIIIAAYQIYFYSHKVALKGDNVSDFRQEKTGGRHKILSIIADNYNKMTANRFITPTHCKTSYNPIEIELILQCSFYTITQ